MQQQLFAREHDTFEVVSFLRAENDTLQERLKHFEGMLRAFLVCVLRASLTQHQAKSPGRSRTRSLRSCGFERRACNAGLNARSRRPCRSTRRATRE
jgi:hypothetical protein